MLILGSTTIVSTRNIGVVTTFGRPSGTLTNGLHWKAPWQSVTEMNGTIRPLGCWPNTTAVPTVPAR